MYIPSVFCMWGGETKTLFMVYKLFHSTLILNTICKFKSIHTACTFSPCSSTSCVILYILFSIHGCLLFCASVAFVWELEAYTWFILSFSCDNFRKMCWICQCKVTGFIFFTHNIICSLIWAETWTGFALNYLCAVWTISHDYCKVDRLHHMLLNHNRSDWH